MELTEIEKDHKLLMRNIVQSLADTPYVLKGGTALMFGYALDRFSEDLDFDSVKKLNLETKIKENLPSGFEIVKITKPKDTNTVHRYKVTTITPNKSISLINTSIYDMIKALIPSKVKNEQHNKMGVGR